MDGLQSKLNSKNPVVISQIFSKLTQTIITEHNQTQPSLQSAEINFLKEKCLDIDPVINSLAAAAITYLIENQILDVKSTLADFVAMIPGKRNPSVISNLIGNLLYFEIKEKLKANKISENLYNLYFPQHPFILLLNEAPDCYKYVYKEIIHFYYRDESIKLLVGNLFRPVFLYTICSPTDNESIIKQKLWHLILNYEDIKNITGVFGDLLCWMQIESCKNVEISNELLIQAISRSDIDHNSLLAELMIVLLTSVLHYLTLNRMDIRATTYNLRLFFHSRNKDLSVINCLLIILAKTVCVCSPVHLKDILEVCEILVESKNTEFYALETLRAGLIYWIGNESLLTNSATQTAKKLFIVIDKSKKYLHSVEPLMQFKTHFSKIINVNNEIFASVHLCLKLHSSANILEFLKHVEQSSIEFIRSIFYPICGLFICKDLNVKISLTALSLILRCIKEYKELTSFTTTLILYQLSNTKHSNIHYEVLKALPKLISLPENLPKVVSTVQAVSKASNDLLNICTKIMFDMWCESNKCYPYLESILLTNFKTLTNNAILERNVIKAFIYKELCEKRPDLHGKDIVPHLSNILNECNDLNGAVPCALAIEGINTLCQAQVIDVVTTWSTLSPKFKEDTRVQVIKSFCKFISEIPQLSYTEQYTDIISQVLDTLWYYVIENQYNEEDETIVDSALTALSFFKLEDICMHMPPNFIDDDKERESCLTNKPLPMLSGGTWVCLQINCHSPNATSKFITKLVANEISGFLKYVYQVKGHKEPENYNYLPRHSVIRGICNHVKKNINKWKTLGENDPHYLQTYRNCLKILSQEYSKPLPPLDWNFLQELIHEPDLKPYCVDIASHQVVMSGSARNFMENFIADVTEKLKDEDILSIYKNLKYLANSVQPVLLKPFFEKSLKHGACCYKKNEKELLINLLNYLKLVLKNPEVQSTNKNTIAQVLKDIVFSTDVNSEEFEEITKCLPYVPPKKLEEICQCNLDSFYKVNFTKIVKIRCGLAVSTKISPLNWINIIIDISSQTERDYKIFKYLLNTFKKNINTSDSPVWLIEFFGQIQAKVADRCDIREIVYHFDVLILAIVVFSGYFVYLTENENFQIEIKNFFPQALSTLLDINEWSICTNQALEWLHHMNSEELIPLEYRNIFGMALCRLRHDDEFAKNLRWLKYLNCKFDG